jgi:hypothetical protein
MTRIVWMLTVAPLVMSSVGCDDYGLATEPTAVGQLRACDAPFRNTLVLVPAPGLRGGERHANPNRGGRDSGCNRQR